MVSCPLLYTGNPCTWTQYLQWDSHYHLPAKYSDISTLTHWAKTVCSNPDLLQTEMEYLRKALTNCIYPTWALDKVEKRLTKSTREVNAGANSQGTAGTQPNTNEVKTKGHLVIPYTKGLCKSIKNICGRHGIQTHFKGNSTIKNLPVSPRDKDPMVNKSGTMYWFQCGDFTCDEEYIGEISRTFGERFKEHLKDLSPMHHHSSNTGPPTTQQNFQIIGREGHG